MSRKHQRDLGHLVIRTRICTNIQNHHSTRAPHISMHNILYIVIHSIHNIHTITYTFVGVQQRTHRTRQPWSRGDTYTHTHKHTYINSDTYQHTFEGDTAKKKLLRTRGTQRECPSDVNAQATAASAAVRSVRE